MQTYVVKLLPGHCAEPDQIAKVTGQILPAGEYIGYNNEPILYDRGWAKKKAGVFGGKSIKYGKNYTIDIKETIVFRIQDLLGETTKSLLLLPNTGKLVESFQDQIDEVLKTSHHELLTIELKALNYMITHYDYVKFI